jgi:hypothetical protein
LQGPNPFQGETMRGRTVQRPWFGRRANRNGEGIRESRTAIFGPVHFNDPAGFKGYFYKTGLEVRVFGSGLRAAQDCADHFVEPQR